MPSPPPPEHTRWKPGQSGNPAGHSKARRVSAALDRLLDEIGGSDKDLALTLYAMATGRKELIKGRKPEFMWFQALMERTDGKVPMPKDNSNSDDDARTIKVIIERVSRPVTATPPESGEDSDDGEAV